MNEAFWHERWARNEIGFHLGEVNPYLLRHWPSLALPNGARVLVPLCGKSLDVAWLVEQGFAVVGVELSEKAVRAFFDEQRLVPQVERRGAFQRFVAGRLEILCGDVFALGAAELEGCVAIYDRAALIALPLALRQRYVDHLTSLMPTGAELLLVTVEYDQAEMSGPPFSVPQQEVVQLYAGRWQLELLARHDVLQQNWKFLQRGLSRLEECVYRMRRR